MERVCVGLWLDHKKAVLTFCTHEEQKRISLHSKIARWSKATGGSRGALPYAYNGGGAADKKDHRREHALHDFYTKILEAISDADSVYLMGPGLAKKELKVFLEKRHFGPRIAGVKDSDQLTENQMAAETRLFFKIPNSRPARRAR